MGAGDMRRAIERLALRVVDEIVTAVENHPRRIAETRGKFNRGDEHEGSRLRRRPTVVNPIMPAAVYLNEKPSPESSSKVNGALSSTSCSFASASAMVGASQNAMPSSLSWTCTAHGLAGSARTWSIEPWR